MSARRGLDLAPPGRRSFPLTRREGAGSASQAPDKGGSLDLSAKKPEQAKARLEESEGFLSANVFYFSFFVFRFSAKVNVKKNKIK